MKYVVVDNCPVPAQLAGTLTDVLRASGASLQSCYRGADAAALLHQCGKRSQAELYDGFRRGLPGFNPANPPGRSTHELRSDGAAYPGPAGRPLLWWQVGIDIDDGHVQPFIREAARRGFTVTVTYPGSRSEYHHVNFRRAPAVTPPLLKRGSRGPRVALLTRRLKRLGYLPGARWNYDDPVVAAVRKFQGDHHQLVDGIVGPQTLRQLVVAIRALKKTT
jgi:Putative peptidoglycan binding domain